MIMDAVVVFEVRCLEWFREFMRLTSQHSSYKVAKFGDWGASV
jgi:hypothetical protein